jgi:RNA polymerase sigma factor (sigma-70 family)
VNISDVINCMQLLKPMIPIDVPNEDGISLENILPDTSTDVAEQAERHMDRLWLRQEVSKALMPYSLWERQILILHYGLDGREPLTLQEIARRKGCSFQYVQHSVKRALGKLRNNQTLKEYYDTMLN